MSVKYVVFYGGPMAAGHNEGSGSVSIDDLRAKIAENYPAHKDRVDRLATEGKIMLIGAFADPLTDGSMAVFRTREEAEAFVAGDPFVLNGVVRSWRLLEWNESTEA
jgi:uncharacterized protein YciI